MTQEQQKPFELIVDKIKQLKSQGKDSTIFEQQIDNMIYKLYELTYDEVKVIDPDFPLSEQEPACRRQVRSNKSVKMCHTGKSPL